MALLLDIRKNNKQGKTMNTFFVKLVALAAGLGLCIGAAAADTRTDEVWTCKIKEGKTMDDVRAANSKWVKFINANVKGGNITSHIVTSVVGDAHEGQFLYVDSYPSLETWSVAKSATEGNKEGEAIDDELQESASCSENRLYSAEKS